MDRNEFMELVYETFADEPDNVLANGIIEAADAYAEHEKAQLSQEGTTSDLISRQAAIDAIHCNIVVTGRENAELVAKTMGEFVDRIKALPTIQPEKTQLSQEGATSDLISRTATIDALMAAIDDVGILDGADIKVVFDNLPPAQPEPQEGHWILVAGELMCSECRTIYSDLYPDYDNSVACPHCGAKMTISTK